MKAKSNYLEVLELLFPFIIIIGFLISSLSIPFIKNEKPISNFTRAKGSVIIDIKNSRSFHDPLKYKVYLRTAEGEVIDFRISGYEKSHYNIGDTIK